MPVAVGWVVVVERGVDGRAAALVATAAAVTCLLRARLHGPGRKAGARDDTLLGAV